jgi:hypothetical protein
MGQDYSFQPNEKIYKLDVVATMQPLNDYIIYTSYKVCKKKKKKFANEQRRHFRNIEQVGHENLNSIGLLYVKQ